MSLKNLISFSWLDHFLLQQTREELLNKFKEYEEEEAERAKYSKSKAIDYLQDTLFRLMTMREKWSAIPDMKEYDIAKLNQEISNVENALKLLK